MREDNVAKVTQPTVEGKALSGVLEPKPRTQLSLSAIP